MNEFDKWNQQKKKIENVRNRRFYHEREVRWCRLGKNIGFEQAGSGERFERPVLIIKAISRQTCFIVPLTSSDIKHSLRLRIDSDSVTLLSQVRIIDTKRLADHMKTISEEKFKEIKRAIQKLFE
jgi:mRNA interferase MazF